jgi:hypothetical protein
MASSIYLNIGEALVGEGNEIAHIDLMIGDKTGPWGPHSPTHSPINPTATLIFWPF